MCCQQLVQGTGDFAAKDNGEKIEKCQKPTGGAAVCRRLCGCAITAQIHKISGHTHTELYLPVFKEPHLFTFMLIAFREQRQSIK